MGQINKNHALTKSPVNPNFETKDYKIVRVAYDDEGTNMFVLVDKLNKKIISYSISGNSERDKFQKIKESKMTPKQEKLLTEKLIRPIVRKMLKESTQKFRTFSVRDDKNGVSIISNDNESIGIFIPKSDFTKLGNLLIFKNN